MMRKLLYILFFSVCFVSVSVAQHPSKLLREGLKKYDEGKFDDAISNYKQAINKGADKRLANYNMGTAYYKAGKPDSALMHWQSIATTDADKDLQARAWHNMGNSFVKQQNFEKAVDAYKRALKLNPDDEDTRYNLAYSQRIMQQQQQQNQDQKKDDQKKDEKQKEDEKKDEDKEKNKEKEQDKPQENKDNMDKNDAEKILQALDNKEKDLHNRKKGNEKGQPVMPTKDW